LISSSCNLSFEKQSDQIHVTIIPSTQHAFVEVQITRDNIGTTSDVFWHPDFISFLRLRFLCQSDPQIKIVRSHSGIIKEVLAFTASITLLQTIPAEQFPFSFEFDQLKYTLSFLEPLFSSSPKPLTLYPFETQSEHFQRFQGQSDSTTARIPLLLPHSDKGGPRAHDTLNTVSFHLLPECDPPIHYFSGPNGNPFYLFISPLDDVWFDNLNLLFPDKPLTVTLIHHENLTLHTPHFVLIETSPDSTFPIPHFDTSPIKFSSHGWITASCFSKSFLLLFTPSQSHLTLLRSFIKDHSSVFSPRVRIGYFPSTEQSIDPLLSASPTEDVEIAIAEPEDIQSSSFPPFCPTLLICYRLLSYLSWSRTFTHIRQRLLETVAGGLHTTAPSILPILTQTLESFKSFDFLSHVGVIELFETLCNDFPLDLQQDLFSSIKTDQNLSPVFFLTLHNFPHTCDSIQLSTEFERLFLYLKDSVQLVLSHPSLLFTCPEFAEIQLAHFLELLSVSFTITSEAKLRTSQSNRAIVLKLSSLLLEPASSASSCNLPDREKMKFAFRYSFGRSTPRFYREG